MEMLREKILIKFFDLSIDRILQPLDHYLIFNDTHIVYHVECYVEVQPQKEEGEYEVKEDYICYHGVILKKSITAIDVYFSGAKDSKYDCWVVEISVYGMPDRTKIRFETQGEAMSLFEKLTDYLLG